MPKSIAEALDDEPESEDYEDDGGGHDAYAAELAELLGVDEAKAQRFCELIKAIASDKSYDGDEMPKGKKKGIRIVLGG